MPKNTYVKPYPYLGDKRVCFECLQHGHSQRITVVLQNHRGFLCESCAKTSASADVINGLRAYQFVRLISQPWIGDIADELLRIADTGFRGNQLEYFQILRERDKYNHLLMDSVRIALEVLTDEAILSESNESIQPIYFSEKAQDKRKKP